MGRGGEVGTSLSLLSLSLPQLGYGCIELEKKGNVAPEVEEALTGNGVVLTPAASARAG